ncbi:hypothetical protein ACS0TY_009693 [Phlomoides rotata]
MATGCNSFQYFTCKPCVRKPMSPIATPHFTAPQETPFLANSCALKLSRPRLNKKVSAVVSEENLVESNDSGTNVFKLTYLEGNSWLWEVGGAKILVDPILVGNLDFGLPWLYDAAKKVLKNFKLDDLPEINCLLITQSLDDHCHLKTLKLLSQKLPSLRVIATPNAKALLDPLFSYVTYLEPGQESEIQVPNGSSVKVRATAGPVLGPPWQRPENGSVSCYHDRNPFIFTMLFTYFPCTKFGPDILSPLPKASCLYIVNPTAYTTRIWWEKNEPT